MEKNEIIYGIHPVEEAINSKTNIKKILISKNKRSNPKILKLIYAAEVHNIKISYIHINKIEQYTADNNHQGVVAFISRPVQTAPGMVDYSKKLYLIMDHITDTHNTGAILRSAEFFNVDGVIIPTRRSAQINDIVKKTSSGAVFHLNIIQIANLNTQIKEFKKNNFWIIGADPKGENDIFNFEFPEKSVIIVGNEEKGISKLLMDNLDYGVNIPGSGKTESLNVSVASALFLFQYRKKWGLSPLFS